MAIEPWAAAQEEMSAPVETDAHSRPAEFRDLWANHRTALLCAAHRMHKADVRQ